MAGRVDYEAAWEELEALILSREGWGSKALVAEMAHIRVTHRVPEELFDRFARLYSDRLQPVLIPPGQEPPADEGTPPASSALTARPTARSEEDHDGSKHRHPVHAHA